jgi:hypothetical protein
MFSLKNFRCNEQLLVNTQVQEQMEKMGQKFKI